MERLGRQKFAGPAMALLGAIACQAGAQEPPPAPRMPDLPPAQIDDTLAIGGEEIDARKLRTRMTVPVRINGTGPYRFVVDSGADTSVVGERIAKDLRLPARPAALLNGVTETRVVETAQVDTLSLGPAEFYDLQLPVLRENDIGADGMIGLDALVEQRLMMDFEKRTITVDDAAERAPYLDGEIVVRAKLRRGQLILTQVKAGRVAMNAIVDTGSEITIGNRALYDKLARNKRERLETIRVFGVTGAAADLELIVVDRLHIGAVTLANVPIAFADVPPFAVFGLDKEPALLLGTDVMEVFRKISLDFRGRKVRFQLRRCAASLLLSTGRTASRLTADDPAACAR